MATPTIPLRIRQNIRDQIVDKDAPLTVTTSKLSTTLGYPITFDPEWGMLWATLHSYYPDQATFIPSVAFVITTWCDAFTAWLEDDSNEEAVERLLDALKGSGSLKLAIEIAPTSTRPTTTWRPTTRSFLLALPKARPSNPQTVLAGFSSDLHQLFTHSPSLLATSDPSQPATLSRASTSASTTSAAAPDGLDDPDAWADLALDSPHSARPVFTPTSSTRGGPGPSGLRNTTLPAGSEDTTPTPLPPLPTLPRPEDLLQSPPYHLLIRQDSPQRVLIEGTHQGTLQLLHDYLQRWVRGDVGFVNRPPMAEISLRESVFGLGLLWDAVVVQSGGGGGRSGGGGGRGREVSALLLVRVVEGVLGYECVSGPAGGGGMVVGGAGMGVWEFRRVRGFK